MERALSILEKGLGPEHPVSLTSLKDPAVVARDSKAITTRSETPRSALEIRERILPPDHPDIAEACHNLAIVVLRFAATFRCGCPRRAGSADLREGPGADHPSTAHEPQRLGVALTLIGSIRSASAFSSARLRSTSESRPLSIPPRRSLRTGSMLERRGPSGCCWMLERALAIDENSLSALAPRVLGRGRQPLYDPLGTRTSRSSLEASRAPARGPTQISRRTLASLTEAEKILLCSGNPAGPRRRARLADDWTPGCENGGYEGSWLERACGQDNARESRTAGLELDARVSVRCSSACGRFRPAVEPGSATDRRTARSKRALIARASGERNRLELALQRSIRTSVGPASTGFLELRSSLPPRAA